MTGSHFWLGLNHKFVIWEPSFGGFGSTLVIPAFGRNSPALEAAAAGPAPKLSAGAGWASLAPLAVLAGRRGGIAVGRKENGTSKVAKVIVTHGGLPFELGLVDSSQSVLWSLSNIVTVSFKRWPTFLNWVCWM